MSDIFDTLEDTKEDVFDTLPDSPVATLDPDLETEEVFNRSGEIWDISMDLNIPLDTAKQNYDTITEVGSAIPEGKEFDLKFEAAPPLSKFQKFKNFFKDDRPDLPRDAGRMEKIDRALDLALTTPLRTFLKFANGRTFGAGDLMWAGIKRMLPEDVWDQEVKNMNLTDAMDWAMGYDPSGFVKTVGGIAEFTGRLQTGKGIGVKTGILGKTPKDIGAVIKATEAAKLFGVTSAVDQISKFAAETIDPTEAEFGFEGPKAVLRDMAIGAAFSFILSGAKGAWSKLTPNEKSRAFKLLKVKKGASTDEIRAAARNLARDYHPDKVEGLRAEFEQVIKARDLLIKGKPQDIVFRGQKIVYKPKLLAGEVAPVSPVEGAPVAKPTTKPVVVPKAVIKPATQIKTVNKTADAAIEVQRKDVFKGETDLISAEKQANKIEDKRATEINKVQQEAKKGTVKEAVQPIPEAIDILGGPDPQLQVQRALKEAKEVIPFTKAEQKAELKKRVGAAAGALRANVKKGNPVEEAIFESSGLLKGELTDYEQRFTSIADTIQPEAKAAMFAKIYNHPDLKYFEVLNTATSFRKLLAGTALTDGDVTNITRVFGDAFADITAERQTVSSLYDRGVALWKAGLLTGIRTSGLNTLSNLGHSMTETAKDIPAALVDSVASLFTGERTLGFTIRGSFSGVKEGFGKGWRYLTTGLDERDVGTKLDFRKVNFGTSKFAKGLQFYEESIFHLLGAEDQPFYYGAKARSIFSQAIAQGKTKGLKGKELDAFVNKRIKAPTDSMLEFAAYDAEVAVFQNRTGFGDIARSVQKVKGGEIIIPFGRTPSAVATQIINYTPIGPAGEVIKQVSKGEFNQRKFSQAFGRGALGTAALFLGGLLLKKDMITLDRPRTEREQKLWELEGRKANSILIGSKWRSAQVLGPAGNVLLIGGHFQKELEETGSPTKAIVQAMSGGAKSFSEQTFVRGVNQAVDALTTPERSFENWFSSMAGSGVPTIVADIARAQDDIERRSEGPLQRVQSRIPGLREKLPPRVNVFGQDLPRYGGNVLEVMIDPSRPSKINRDIVVDELRRLADNDIKVTPTLLGDKHGFKILSVEENTQLWRRSGELTYKLLMAWIDTDAYRGISNDFAKGQTVDAIVSRAKAAAKAEIVSIKLAQGVGIVELAEDGLMTIDNLEAIQFFGRNK